MSDRLLEQLREHYDAKHAHDLDVDELNLVPLDFRWPSERVQAAVPTLGACIPSGAKILEVGAGDGGLAESLRVGGVEFSSYTIMELSRLRLEGLRRHLTDARYRFIEGDVETLTESTDEVYDVVIMVALIEHLVDPLGVMRQVSKILRPGGFAYVDTPNVAKWTRRARLALGRFPATSGRNEGLVRFDGEPVNLYDEGHLHYFTYRAMELMLTTRCGFSRTKRHSYFCGPRGMPVRIGHMLAKLWPPLFGELAITAYAE